MLCPGSLTAPPAAISYHTYVTRPVKTPGDPGGSWPAGLLLSGSVAALARGARALRGTGPLVAAGIGTAVFRAGGLRWSAVLLTFFASATLLTRLPGSRRDRAGRTGRQVLANGAVAALAAWLSRRWPMASRAFAGAVAAACADTWATELGVRYGGTPRHLTTGARVPPGSSGGVTLLGTVAGAAGAAVCGLVARATGTAPLRLTARAGVIGMLLDSLLGATLQARYRCPRCGEIGEGRRCGCGAWGQRISGLGGLDNDGVNFLATVLGALVAYRSPDPSPCSLKTGRMPMWKMSSRE
ncbi:MAG: DUF92 domain-containing protein [Armatimonadota bacterium]|nr:DUF92 domain-containing protein [Armatimonadota bacterium]MDR7438775.1 DUF92 domain-containing protein [Armatimonadota bacterium]MDR7561991.1 DUF92 domain-containing protein [Armatimonadota bacterium]MDR7568546.1 DUF92 domain-containing protein [Armatimonadota bacterium]MDR7602570.1 DUF92 domain-containing protein [Armatimonadota bacterium]